jgi:DNA-binding winged helix-turn-helix (wHTH) protein
MFGTREIREYRFGRYRLLVNQQCLYRDDTAVTLSTKVYYLLLALVANAGQILTKDQITAAVWPGQVVTDTALAKQVLRVRRLLEDQGRPQPYIETHRGVGYRFTVAVSVIGQDAKAPSARSARPTGLIDTGTAAAQTTVVVPATGSASVVMVRSAEAEDWSDYSAIEYLAIRLRREHRVHVVPARARDSTAPVTDQPAPDSRWQNPFDFSCELSVSHQNDDVVLQATLRGKSGYVHSNSFRDALLHTAFEGVANWIHQQLPAQQAPADTLGAPPTRDEHALLSYLRGVTARKSHADTRKALDCFRAAVDLDPEFLQAWVALALTLSDQGQQFEAIAIGTTLIGKARLHDDGALSTGAHLAIARAYQRAGDHESARHYAAKTRAAASALQEPYTRLIGLESLALLAWLESDFAAAEALGLERLSLARIFYPVENYIASLHLELALHLNQSLLLDKLREHAEAALTLAQSTGNTNGMLSAYRYLNMSNYLTNRLDEGVQIAVTAEALLEKSTFSDDKAAFLQFSAMILNLRGLFERAARYSEQLRQLARDSNSGLFEVMGDLTVVHRLYAQGEFALARDYAWSMRSRFEDNAIMRSALPLALAIEILVAARIDKPEVAAALLSEFDKKYAAARADVRKELNRAQAHLAVRQGKVAEGIALLTQTESEHRSLQQHSVANYVGYETLEILLAHPEFEYQETLARLQAHSRYDYHLFKLKAQFLAREGNYLEAAMLMQQNRLRANRLWRAQDQQLLEHYIAVQQTEQAEQQ